MRSTLVLSMFLCAGVAACDVRQVPPRSQAREVRQQGEVSRVPLASAIRPDLEIERPMSFRREAQGALDSAREALDGGDTAVAHRLLNRAAAFFLVQASSPPSGGTGSLLSVSARLDSLAGRLSGQPADVRRLRRLSAEANLAEAERHGALASVAWSTRSERSVSDELLIAADHLERAATDVSLPLPRRTRELLAELRSVARRVATDREADVQELDEPLASLHMEVVALRAALPR